MQKYYNLNKIIIYVLVITCCSIAYSYEGAEGEILTKNKNKPQIIVKPTNINTNNIIPNPIINKTNEFQAELSQEEILEHKQELRNSFVSLKMGNTISTDTDSNNTTISTDTAKLIIINKITAKPHTEILKVGKVKFIGNMSIEVNQCIKNTDPYHSDNLMLITVFDNKIEEENLSIFHGWMVSSNLSLSTIEHPVYEIIPIDCINEAPK